MWSNTNRGESSRPRQDNDNSYVFEQQNDMRMDELGSKLSALKNITIDMHQDVNTQDRLLDKSDQAFGGLEQTMRQSYSRMNRMISTRHKRQMFNYVAIIVAVFFFIYFFSGYLFGSSLPAEGSSDVVPEQGEHEKYSVSSNL